MLFGHGVGSRGDLPLPLWMFTWAAAIALIVSFVALGVLWTKPRLAAAAVGRTIDVPGPLRLLQVVGQVAALALLLVSLWAGLAGVDDTNGNLLPVTIFVIVWVGGTLLSGLIGDVWGAINPVVTLGRGAEKLGQLVGVRSEGPAPRTGHWPAAAGLFVFLFYELAHPSGSSPRTLGTMLLVHLVVCSLAAARWGAKWLEENEPFTVMFALIGAMAPIRRTAAGRLQFSSPIAGLAAMPIITGSAAALIVVLGGTTFDGFSESELGRDVLGRPEGWGGAVTLTIGLVGSIAVIAALYAIGVQWTARVSGLEFRQIWRDFAPSLVPIVFGYAIAHYAQLLVDETQSFWFRLSDPLGRGWNLFGAADGVIDFTIISVDLIAWVQVLAILFGHIGAVIVAHDMSVSLVRLEESLRSQFAMLIVMVAYSTLGLWLLLNA